VITLDIQMQGGSIIGEGKDGCVLTEPLWPCSSQTDIGQAPNPSDNKYVSKIILKTDEESIYIKVAARLIGSNSSLYIAELKSECSPANSLHPPVSNKMESFQLGKSAVLGWNKQTQACGKLKESLKSKKGISNTHKVLYISRYPMGLDEWLEYLQYSNKSIKQTIKEIMNALPSFIDILQRLFQSPAEKLIHLDLHYKNIFVRPSDHVIQFGISDFGHCLLLRQNNSEGFIKYLCDYIVNYSFYCNYIQVPLESRLLNFCFINNYDSKRPIELIEGWLNDPELKNSLSINKFDVILLNPEKLLNYLLEQQLFIAMIEKIQSISKKIRKDHTNPSALIQSLTPNDMVAIEFILTRYSIVSPINVITESILSIMPTTDANTRCLTEFVMRMIVAPYDQEGSSLSTSLKSVQDADMRFAWTDVINEFSV